MSLGGDIGAGPQDVYRFHVLIPAQVHLAETKGISESLIYLLVAEFIVNRQNMFYKKKSSRKGL